MCHFIASNLTYSSISYGQGKALHNQTLSSQYRKESQIAVAALARDLT